MLPITKKLIHINYSVGVVINPKYIIVHETDNTNKGADAMAHYNYWSTTPSAQASTHFVVDDHEIVQMLELNQRSWNCGDNKGHSDIINSNTISLEICVNSDGNYTKARQNAIDLVKYLMQITGIKADHVVRHYDSSGKYCPRTMLDHPELWIDFKNQISGQSNLQGGNSTMILKIGSKGPEVGKLQSNLKTLGYNVGDVDSDFGNITDAAVKQFQKDNGFTVDGEAGPITLNKIAELIKAKETPAPQPVQQSANGLPGYHLEYKVHVQDIGWMDWVKEGEVAGTVGQGKRIEAIQIRIVKD